MWPHVLIILWRVILWELLDYLSYWTSRFCFAIWINCNILKTQLRPTEGHVCPLVYAISHHAVKEQKFWTSSRKICVLNVWQNITVQHVTVGPAVSHLVCALYSSLIPSASIAKVCPYLRWNFQRVRSLAPEESLLTGSNCCSCLFGPVGRMFWICWCHSGDDFRQHGAIFPRELMIQIPFSIILFN